MAKYVVISRKSFDKMFQDDNMKGWRNMGGFWDKKSAISQMDTYSGGKGKGMGRWALVPPAPKTKYSGGYYNVLIRESDY